LINLAGISANTKGLDYEKVTSINQTLIKSNKLLQILYKPLKSLILCCLLLTSTAYSWDYKRGPFTVSKLRFGAGDVFVALDPAPKGCGGGNQYRMHLQVSNSNQQQYDDMVAGLLAANTTGQKLEYIWYTGKGTCSQGHILKLHMFEYIAKQSD
jgi:hypothetical protein